MAVFFNKRWYYGSVCGCGLAELLLAGRGGEGVEFGGCCICEDGGGAHLVRLYASASPAGRGGEGRAGFCVALWLLMLQVMVVLFLLFARAGRGGEASGDRRRVVFVVVCLGDAVSAGSSVVRWRRCCGCARSARLGFVARRRTTHAASNNVWRRPLPGGWRYGDGGVG